MSLSVIPQLNGLSYRIRIQGKILEHPPWKKKANLKDRTIMVDQTFNSDLED